MNCGESKLLNTVCSGASTSEKGNFVNGDNFYRTRRVSVNEGSLILSTSLQDQLSFNPSIEDFERDEVISFHSSSP